MLTENKNTGTSVTRSNNTTCCTHKFRDLEPFDWYQRYAGLKHILNKYIKHSAKILMVGAGTSRKSSKSLCLYLANQRVDDPIIAQQGAECEF